MEYGHRIPSSKGFAPRSGEKAAEGQHEGTIEIAARNGVRLSNAFGPRNGEKVAKARMKGGSRSPREMEYGCRTPSPPETGRIWPKAG
jgi:hypothetical protein